MNQLVRQMGTWKRRVDTRSRADGSFSVNTIDLDRLPTIPLSTDDLMTETPVLLFNHGTKTLGIGDPGPRNIEVDKARESGQLPTLSKISPHGPSMELSPVVLVSES